MKTIILIVLFVFVIPICFLASSKKKDEKAKAEKQRAAEEKRRQLEEAERQKQAEREAKEAEQEAKEAERAEWESRHGRFNTNLAGVTFDNEDGSSRQKLLKKYYNNGVKEASLELKEFDYKGKPAVAVLLDGQCVGNIPQNRVDELLQIMDRLEKGNLEVDVFRPDEDDDDPEERKRRGGTIYRADLFLIYRK